MAIDNHTAPAAGSTITDTSERFQFFGMEESRASLLIDGSGEIEALADLAIKELGHEYEVRAIRALVNRIREVNSIMLSAIGDEAETTEALRERLAA